jgi:hypothetical protein
MGQMGAHMHAGPHMRFTDARAATDDDRKRAEELLHRLREGLGRYANSDAAVAEGYQPFLPTVPQDVYHFVSYPETAREYAGGFDALRPGSLLYAKRAGRYQLVGVMYSAPATATPDDLDRRVPLGVARWHAHVNVCLPAGITLEDLTRGEIGAGNPHLAGALQPTSGLSRGVAEQLNRRYGFMADGRFGFEGRIATAEDCGAAGGSFLPQAWGWMVHVYPFARTDLAAAFGMDVPD